MDTIRFVDTTLRDGHQSLWAENMTTGMMLPIARNIDEAGFEGIELISGSHLKKTVRELRGETVEEAPSVAIDSSSTSSPARNVGSPKSSSPERSTAVSSSWSASSASPTGGDGSAPGVPAQTKQKAMASSAVFFALRLPSTLIEHVTVPSGSSVAAQSPVDHAATAQCLAFVVAPTVVLNGRSRTVYVAGSTVKDVLEHINVRLRQGDLVEPSRSARIEEGDVIVFREAVQVRVVIDGQDRRVITNAPSVAYLLDSMGVVLEKRDRVIPSADSELGSGTRIRVVRVKVGSDTEQVAIPFGTNVVYSDRLLQGQRQVDRVGVAGLQELTYKVRLEDGVEVSKQLLERRVLREPVNQVLVIGTREPNVQWGIAPWYDWDGRSAPCGGTLSGLYAAHRTLPCGTRVTVLNQANGRTVTVVIRDRGPWIGGRIIDLSVEAFSQIAPLGAGTIRVRFAR